MPRVWSIRPISFALRQSSSCRLAIWNRLPSTSTSSRRVPNTRIYSSASCNTTSRRPLSVSTSRYELPDSTRRKLIRRTANVRYRRSSSPLRSRRASSSTSDGSVIKQISSPFASRMLMYRAGSDKGAARRTLTFACVRPLAVAVSDPSGSRHSLSILPDLVHRADRPQLTLCRDELVIESPARHQLVVRPRFDQAAVVEHDQPVRVPNGRQPVGDDERRPVSSHK